MELKEVSLGECAQQRVCVGRGGGAMMSGFSITSMVLTPCQTDPVQDHNSNGSSKAART